MNAARGRAKQMLTHYVATAFSRAGVAWTNNFQVQVEGIVDDIIAAAVHEVAEVFEKAAREHT